jgi:hypothetical protein
LENRYEKLIRENLRRFYAREGQDQATALGAEKAGSSFTFMAFGEDCLIEPARITLSGRHETGPQGLIISLYALHAGPHPPRLEPFQAFKDLPCTMPYHGAFRANSETLLVPHVPEIMKNAEKISLLFRGGDAPDGLGGDFAFVLYPLPKIALCYLFYLPDEDFPASITCLFSANALSFMPVDGLADTAEYTSRRLMALAR